MIRLSVEEDSRVILAETRGCPVYLDNWAIINLAKGCPSRRQRFVDALRQRGTLLFSWTNAIELAGPQGTSAEAVRNFLDSLGPHWVPVEMNPWTVVKREGAGLYAQAAVSESFMEAYTLERFASRQSACASDTSPEHFFRLGTVLDWVQKDRDSLGARTAEIHGALRDTLGQWRAQYETDLRSLDGFLPTFEECRPATFVLLHLLHLLVRELKGYEFTPNDSLDFCHAVMGAAYGGLATLDREWKRRIESLPTPNNLAKIHYAPELDEFVSILESVEISS
jgi:hypothetical protein